MPQTSQPLVDYIQGAPHAKACMGDYTALDDYVLKHAIADVQARRIPGFPFLRMNRFLASFTEETMSRGETEFWLQQLAQLDLEGRRVELAAIPLPELQKILPQSADRETVRNTLQDCGEILVAQLLSDNGALEKLRSRLNAPDDYQDILRVVGLYPVSSLPVRWGVQKLHEQTRMRLETPFSAGADQEIISYAASENSRPDTTDISHIINSAGDNALGIPLFSHAQLAALFRYFAPVFEIETADEADLPGRPVWQDDQTIAIDTKQPTVFTHLSHARFYDRILLQLNYTIWFPERPLDGRFDLLGGHLDGVTWRITLDTSGQPLFYDVIHNCGCYHIVFARENMRQVKQDDFWQEPLLVLPLPVASDENRKLVLSFASGNHYLSQVRYTLPGHADKQYSLADYDRLRQLPFGNATSRSMFDARGLVPGSERSERWVLWPMGVLEPGAMRQWGHHAIAFIGKRYFDDPFLWEKNFKRPE